MPSPTSSALEVHNRVTQFFGGQMFSPSPKLSFEKVKSMILSSKNRLAILFTASFLISIYILYSSKADMVMKKTKTFSKNNKVCRWKLIMYGLLFGLILTAVLSFLLYQFPKTRKLLFPKLGCSGPFCDE